MTLLTDPVRALIGQQKKYQAPEPLGAAAGRYYGLAVGDMNPLYSDAEFAREQGLQGVTAPLTLICETNQYAGLPMDSEGYAGHTWGLEIPGTRTVRGGNAYTFHRRIRPQDVITAVWEITGATEKTTSKGLDMLIIASRASYFNQGDELLAENEETVIFVALDDAV